MPEHIVKPLVMIESPYAGDIDTNVKYARLCVRDSVLLGEAPFASHLLYTQSGILLDTIPAERKLGIESGFAWGLHADLIAVYIDLGISSGMQKAIDYYMTTNTPITYRQIPVSAAIAQFLKEKP